MNRYRLLLLFCLMTGFQMASHAQGQGAPAAKAPMTNDAKIKSALSAAPAGISKDAAVMAPGAAAGAPMIELKKGTNGWTCLPDMADTPGNDPMCMDKIAMEWADAWMHKKPMTITSIGIGYMLAGGSTADNDDPFAKQPKAGKQWLMEPPHLMIFGTKIDPAVYSNTPNTTRPWVMWKGTPYEHLMVPVK
ncbi:MAG: hypothetical protein HY651_06365 [Acidobacteria bacterium]|nr:hypothetical protein [Acidobacteriota bacterium]